MNLFLFASLFLISPCAFLWACLANISAHKLSQKWGVWGAWAGGHSTDHVLAETMCVCNRIPIDIPHSAPRHQHTYVIQWNECFIGLMELTRMRPCSLSLENSKVYRNEKGQFNLIWPQDTHMRIQQDMQKRLCGIAAIIHTCDHEGKCAGRWIRCRMGILNLWPLIALMINLISN